MNLIDFLQAVYIPQHDLRKHTVYHLQAAVKAFERWRGEPVTLAELSDDRVAGWLTAMLDAGTPRATIKGYRGGIITLWRFAFERGDVAMPPRLVKKVKLSKRIPSAWTLDQFTKLIEAARREPGDIGRHAAADWWVALLLVGYDTGARITPIMNLATADIDLLERRVVFRAEHVKTGRDETFAISEDTTAAVRTIYRPGRELLFGDWRSDRSQMSWPALTKRYRRILHRAGLPAGRRDLFHRVRRTTATQLAKTVGNVEAAQLLGHSSPVLTEAAYIDSSQIKRRTPADILPRPGKDGVA
ncbi:MAG: tyrosine-type recombinase/integrase [Pirellulaceae bacterium]